MSTSSNTGFLFKSGIFALIVGALYYFFNVGSNPNTSDAAPAESIPYPSETQAESPSESPTYLPSGGKGAFVDHTYFSLGYNETHELAEWVAYEVTLERLINNHAARPNSFRADPLVSTGSADYKDYTNSGYDRGHLCAAADMAFDEKAIDETFVMSNISPQEHYFNLGIWRELEELTRDWARKYEHLYVITGPILADKSLKKIGEAEVSVPKRYYKVLYAEGRTIGFVLPNALSNEDIMKYALSVDEVERITGLDFFPKLLTGNMESLEAAYRPSDWPVDRSRAVQRVEIWNQVGRE